MNTQLWWRGLFILQCVLCAGFVIAVFTAGPGSGWPVVLAAAMVGVAFIGTVVIGVVGGGRR